MGQVWNSGEISNFTQPASGHWSAAQRRHRPGTLRDVPQQQPPGDLPSTALDNKFEFAPILRSTAAQ
ncbi:hypothetical protein ACNKHS_15170 [Shigella flexneri]